MDVAGTWSSAELTIEIAVVDGRVSGALVLGGARMPMTGSIQGAQLVGSFDAEGHAFELVAHRDGEELVVASEGVEYRLRRPAPARVNPLKAARAATAATTPMPHGAPTAGPPPVAPPGGDDGGTLYRHPTGGEMRLPRGWQITQNPQVGLQLIPSEQKMTPQGPAELYLVSAQPAPGVARPDDPQVIAFVDATLRQVIPTLAAPSRPSPCGPGTRVTWEGKNLQTGAPIRAAALLQIADGAIAGIVAIGEAERIEARMPALEQIFGSFRKGEGRRDPALVGVWHHWSWRGGKYTSSESRRAMQLGAGGEVVERSSHEGVGNFTGKDGGGNTAWTAGYASQDQDGRTGTWTAGDGMLYLTWSDGTSAAWQYQLGGGPGNRKLILLAPGAREPVEWTERPVQV